jgi:hypothetical protein
VLDFAGWQRLNESIGYHILGRTIEKPNRALLDDPADEMEPNSDVILRYACQDFCTPFAVRLPGIRNPINKS